jgi:hypothetical protein
MRPPLDARGIGGSGLKQVGKFHRTQTLGEVDKASGRGKDVLGVDRRVRYVFVLIVQRKAAGY